MSARWYVDVTNLAAQRPCGDHADEAPFYECCREHGHAGPHACEFAMWGNENDGAAPSSGAETLRDRFAMAALNGLLADGSNLGPDIFAAAYAFADGMLVARGGK